jgi:hypothetical protein
VTQAPAQGGIAVERGEVAEQLTGAAGHDRFDHQDAGRVLGNFMLAGADCLNMTRLALSLSGYVNGVPRKHAQTAQGMFPDHQVHAITNFYCHPGSVDDARKCCGTATCFGGIQLGLTSAKPKSFGRFPMKPSL